ncbi:hypothetical protein A5646_12845 [Mycobacterium sp. 1245499.0]|uniref:hypothetical protein n=1 Tax=Mycobacterium sp. 1245499.0 TaxID=1834074 RepID=UPI000800C3DE|nr:hypothetical protein [Mycobacterium sp. 1245499.0]OBL08218.1 hypothetical protein A5646_12845 [Mycobacterium sp. 1245499.0]
MTQPDYFSITFWRAALNHVIYGAAIGASNSWILGGVGSVDSDTHLSIPGWGVAAGALSGAILAFILAIVGQAVPGTPPTSFVPAPAVKSARARRPRKAAPVKAPAEKPAAKKPPAK